MRSFCCILTIALLLTACGEKPAPAEKTETHSDLTAMALRPCPQPDPGRSCEYDHATLPGELTKALGGDYQAQRNVSYALTSGSPWVVQDTVRGCAWRIVALANRPASSTYDDAGMYRIQCEGLPPADLADARDQAEQITSAIRS